MWKDNSTVYRKIDDINYYLGEENGQLWFWAKIKNKTIISPSWSINDDIISTENVWNEVHQYIDGNRTLHICQGIPEQFQAVANGWAGVS